MMFRMLSLVLATLALALFAGAPVSADQAKKAADGKTAERGDRYEGTVVSVTDDELVVKDKARSGEKAATHTQKLADKAKVTSDGKKCKLADLKPGQKVQVTTQKGDKTIAIRVDALDKNEKFEKLDGKTAEKKVSDRTQR